MSEKQFEAFDERFREAAEQYEPPFDEASWNKLESRLDPPAPVRRRGGGWWWITDALMLALLLFIAYHFISSGNSNTASKENNPSIPITSQQELRSNQQESMADGKASETVTGNQQTGSETSKTGTTNITADDVSVVNEGNRKTMSGSSSQPVNRPQSTGSDPKRYDRSSSAMNGNSIASDSKTVSATGSLLMNDGAGASASNGTGLPVSSNPSADSKQQMVNAKSNAIDIPNDKLVIGAEMSIEKIDSADLAAKPVTKDVQIPGTSNKPSAQKSRSNASGFYVYGMAGSEWSLVPGNEAGEATFAWGLGLGYRLSPRWALQAGYFRTRKVYDAGPGDYKPKPGTYYYNLTIKHVEADCEIAEIPIAVSYSLLNTRKQSLFATVGLSSYIMNSEEYHYDYIRANQMPGYSKYHYETHDSHLFAGLLLSGGYSYTLFDGFSLSAEPYFKIPLYGVGEGSIKIYNFGLMAGARYSLPSFRKK